MRNKNDAKSEVASFINYFTIPIITIVLIFITFSPQIGKEDRESTISEYEDTIAYYEEENSILKREIEELNIILDRLEEDYDDLEEDYYNLQKEFEVYKKNNFFVLK